MMVCIWWNCLLNFHAVILYNAETTQQTRVLHTHIQSLAILLFSSASPGMQGWLDWEIKINNNKRKKNDRLKKKYSADLLLTERARERGKETKKKHFSLPTILSLANRSLGIVHVKWNILLYHIINHSTINK